MFNIEKITLSLGGNTFLLFVLIIAVVMIILFAYRYTFSTISSRLKYLLIALRVTSLILLLFLLFEPLLTLSYSEEIKPKIVFAIDNSLSMAKYEEMDKIESVKNLLDDLNSSSINNEAELISFGYSHKELENFNDLSFDESSTNFNSLFQYIQKNKKSANCIVIISDGVVTEGAIPASLIKQLNIPIYTIAVGDTSKDPDVKVNSIFCNDLIYQNSVTPILVSLGSENITAQNFKVRFFEENKFIQEEEIFLQPNDSRTVTFFYNPIKTGEVKLTFEISSFINEKNIVNNKKTIFIKVLSGKKKIAVISSSPSPDFRFISNAIKNDTNYSLIPIIQINQNEYIEGMNKVSAIDSADALFLIGIPVNVSLASLLKKVEEVINIKSIPFFILIQKETAFNRLTGIAGELPINIASNQINWNQTFVYLPDNEVENPLIQNSALSVAAAWGDLPPITSTILGVTPKSESKVILKAMVNNVPTQSPILISRKLGARKSIAIIGSDIWRWKLQRAEKYSDLFDSFILNSVKWLTADTERKNVKITTNKKFYSQNEMIKFNAEVLNENFIPISDARVKINISSKDKRDSILMTSIGNGFYEGEYNAALPGDFYFSGEAVSGSTLIGKDNGRFSVEDINIELIKTKCDTENLKYIADISGGKYFYQTEQNKIWNELQSIIDNAKKNKIITEENSLWFNPAALWGIIFLLAIEWFIRKREGLL